MSLCSSFLPSCIHSIPLSLWQEDEPEDEEIDLESDEEGAVAAAAQPQKRKRAADDDGGWGGTHHIKRPEGLPACLPAMTRHSPPSPRNASAPPGDGGWVGGGCALPWWVGVGGAGASCCHHVQRIRLSNRRDCLPACHSPMPPPDSPTPYPHPPHTHNSTPPTPIPQVRTTMRRRMTMRRRTRRTSDPGAPPDPQPVSVGVYPHQTDSQSRCGPSHSTGHATALGRAQPPAAQGAPD